MMNKATEILNGKLYEVSYMGLDLQMSVKKSTSFTPETVIYVYNGFLQSLRTTKDMCESVGHEYVTELAAGYNYYRTKMLLSECVRVASDNLIFWVDNRDYSNNIEEGIKALLKSEHVQTLDVDL